MRILLVSIFFLAINVAFSQTVSLPDSNLTNKLIASYPQVMQGKTLIVSAAAALTGTLNLQNANISDATGVQYFISLTTLDLGNNQITKIPDISPISGLVNFYATNNKLTTIPAMTALTQLHDFQVMNNQLTALPDLSGSSGLLFLYCSNNNITKLPPLSQFPQLSILVVGQNFLGTSVDVSLNVNLMQLHVHETGIDTIIGLDKLSSLSILYAWSNNIKSFSTLDSITTLTLCCIFDNPMSKLPYLQNKPNLATLNVQSCNLTFENIQPVLQNNPPAAFTYVPQRTINYNDVTARATNICTLTYPVSSPLTTNSYVWLKNGVVIDSSASPSFVFNPIVIGSAGNYSLKIYNSITPTLVLYTDTFKVSVLPCIQLNITAVNIISKDCSKGYAIDFSQNQISGGTPPFQYELATISTKKTIAYPIVQNVEPGNYFLTVTDSKNCYATDNFTLNTIADCEIIMTPNGDGIADTYFIENTGKVSVFDLKRNLVNTLQAPIVWDGRDRNGNLLDAGLYILIMDGEKPIYLTIIR